MTNNKDTELDEVLHNLDHQKWEAIGVEKLTKDSTLMMSVVMLVVKTAHTNAAQDLGVIWALHELLMTQSCSSCLGLAERIKNQIVNDYHEWKAETGE